MCEPEALVGSAIMHSNVFNFVAKQNPKSNQASKIYLT